MNGNQTILTLGAFAFLSVMLLNFNTTVALTGTDIMSGEDGILAATIATSYLELAQGTAFDEVTDTSDAAIANPSVLTSPSYLGPEDASEDSVQNFNDFDDFDGLSLVKEVNGTHRRFKTMFEVHYVDPNDIKTISSNRTFLKRLDLKTWRVFPPPGESERIDTLRSSLVMGYFHFD